MRFLVEALHGIAVDWQPMLLIMAVLSLALGNNNGCHGKTTAQVTDKGVSGLVQVFGQTRSVDQIANGQAERLALVFGVVFVVAGLAFKLTAAPFHMWKRAAVNLKARPATTNTTPKTSARRSA
ncbi:NADH:ubiquinone oxidoreductase subunit N [Alcaligenes faecalis subsp. faecalis NCIB 8687]|nr:NADH:ubiquinone oxidoreductase subunit N [Alcaligenes faecalis subsp. faecalis NCIB 8687]